MSPEIKNCQARIARPQVGPIEGSTDMVGASQLSCGACPKLNGEIVLIASDPKKAIEIRARAILQRHCGLVESRETVLREATERPI